MTDSIDRLYEAVLAARGADPASSRTARLLRAGRNKMAKKVAEEAVEVVIDAMQNQRDAVVRESADLLYNLVVLWSSLDIHPTDIWKEMNRRERLLHLSRVGVPHVRGDEPAHPTVVMCSTDAFPTCVGMNRSRCIAWSTA